MLNDNTVLGYTAKGVKICYSDFKKNIYIIRSIAPRTLTPEGELLVNGDLFVMLPSYINLAGEPDVCCDATIQCGDFETYGENLIEITYQIPTDPGYWRNFFIVSGEVMTDETGTPTTYRFLSIPRSRRLEFRRLILKLKPLHAWGVLMVTWT